MIYLIRHGETALNAQRVLQPEQTPLNDVGERQAHALGQRMAQHFPAPAQIIYSPLPRTRDTALAIHAAYGQAHITLSAEPDLQERNFGDYRGKPYTALGTSVLTYQDKPPNGESAKEFSVRVAAVFKRIIAQANAMEFSKQPLAIVTHGLVIRELLATHLKLPESAAMSHTVANTALTVFNRRSPHLIQLLACDAHLAPS